MCIASNIQQIVISRKIKDFCLKKGRGIAKEEKSEVIIDFEMAEEIIEKKSKSGRTISIKAKYKDGSVLKYGYNSVAGRYLLHIVT